MSTEELAIFASGTGSNAAALIDYFQAHPRIQIKLVVSDVVTAGVLTIARKHRIATETLLPTQISDGEYLYTLMQVYDIEWIVCAGYLKKIPNILIAHFPNRIFNIHPSLLPKFGGKGMYGLRIHQAVLAANENISGLTIHWVNSKYDQGEIILQVPITIDKTWDAPTLQQHILALEHYHYPRTVEREILKTFTAPAPENHN
jgi:phosphoribosylglycinamide formyltransferase-1